MRSLWRRFMAWWNQPDEVEIRIVLRCDATQAKAAFERVDAALADLERRAGENA